MGDRRSSNGIGARTCLTFILSKREEEKNLLSFHGRHKISVMLAGLSIRPVVYLDEHVF